MSRGEVVGAHDRWRILWALETRFRRVTWFFAARCRLAGWRDGCDLRAVTRAIGAPEPAGPAAVRRSRTAGWCDRQQRRMTRVHLVRHARTASNRERRTMGWLDEGIEPGWVRAAAAVADVLAREPVDRLVSSPLARAVQTAAPLAALLSRQPILDERFGELRVGPWEGFTEDEIAERWPQHWQCWRSEPHALQLEGRETLADLNARVAGALDELFADLLDGRVAVVFTHDAVVRAAVAWALGTGPEIYRHVEVANCSITTVGMAAGVRRLVRTNEDAHLGGLNLEP